MSFFQEKANVKRLTFDDVLLVPAYSEILPHKASAVTKFTHNITLSIPIVSMVVALKQVNFVRI
ncbi:MAG: IMP dehydrogenase [Prevotellaceae bacterium]|jgi:IMP dehydrogenase|nr:IMP dehydrogenase [Prevotellaceae bacterium]